MSVNFFPQGPFATLAHGSNQFLGGVLHVVQDLIDGVALDHLVDADVPIVFHRDMDGIGVAEEVMQVARIS